MGDRVLTNDKVPLGMFSLSSVKLGQFHHFKILKWGGGGVGTVLKLEF